MRAAVAVLALATLLTGFPAAPAKASVATGEILVVDAQAGTDGAGALFVVDPATGRRRILSDFGDAAQGPLGVDPWSVVAPPGGPIYVLDQAAGIPGCVLGGGCGTIFSVDPATGRRTVVSDLGDPAAGPTATTPYSLAIDRDGHLLVADQDGGASPGATFASNTNGALFRVDPSDGGRTIVSSFEDPTRGPTGGAPSGVAVAPSGRAVVTDAFYSLLFSVDADTGTRTQITDFRDARGPLGLVPIATAAEASGSILVADQLAGNGPDGLGALFRVDALTGQRTILSDFTRNQQGPRGINLSGLRVAGDGRILLVDFDAGTAGAGALFRIHPSTGERSYLSDFGDPSLGALGEEPAGVEIMPAPPPPPPPGPTKRRETCTSSYYPGSCRIDVGRCIGPASKCRLTARVTVRVAENSLGSAHVQARSGTSGRRQPPGPSSVESCTPEPTGDGWTTCTATIVYDDIEPVSPVLTSLAPTMGVHCYHTIGNLSGPPPLDLLCEAVVETFPA